MDNTNFLPVEKGKSLWNNNERIVGIITALAAFGGLGYLLHKALPYIIAILENTLYTILLLALIVIPTVLIWKNRKILWVLYQIYIQKMWWAIANAYPIEIMKRGLNKWIERRDEVNQRITDLEADHDLLGRRIEEQKTKAQDSFKTAIEAKNQKKDVMANSKAVRAQRLLQSNEKLYLRYDAIGKALVFLKRLHERWDVEIQDLADDIDLKESDLKILKHTSSALKSAQSLIQGEPDELALASMANQAYAQQVSDNVAYITRFMENGKKWMDSADIQDAILSNEGAKLLEMYDETTFAQLTNMKDKIAIPANKSGLSGSSGEALDAFGNLK